MIILEDGEGATLLSSSPQEDVGVEGPEGDAVGSPVVVEEEATGAVESESVEGPDFRYQRLYEPWMARLPK